MRDNTVQTMFKGSGIMAPRRGFTFTRPPCTCMTYLGVYVHKAAMHVHAIPGGLRSQGCHARA
eukprot:8207265-Pyramimonas_sp.AAC.1